ncbi:MAG TPA: HAMP domain-containing histidine kinase [Candidatus Aenigmarchaeota archaeon]|nr:MAG: hypothetical protein DRP03_02785 [Candidatus Aenigmarchaeota archaeon]HDD46309.1 HAMP domain-containing histidine kinase [Candidatus Aenigmarchaeota archaeon]
MQKTGPRMLFYAVSSSGLILNLVYFTFMTIYCEEPFCFLKFPFIPFSLVVLLTIPLYIILGFYVKKQFETEEKLVKAMKRILNLEKLDRLKTLFLTTVSHEIKTPITPIKAQLQMILKGYFGKLNKEQAKSLYIVLDNIDRLDGLISDILDVSRIEAGTIKFVFEKAKIGDVVNEAFESMKQFAKNKEIILEKKIEDTGEMVFDRDRIMQVIVNLINNAIKFTPKGGKVSIYVKKHKRGAVVIVEDTGIGIPRNKLKQIFKPFYQVDSSYNRKFGGAGLGLSICKGIIEYHGGKVWVESKVGRGSKFYFFLPRKPKPKDKSIKLLNP